jgi:hypothetical protein
MSRIELLQACKTNGIKGTSALTKSELIEKLKEYESFQKLSPFLKELVQTIPMDIKRKVCTICEKAGHSPIKCPTYETQNVKWKQQIKEYLLTKDLSDDTIHLETVSKQLHISIAHCTSLYKQIPKVELQQRKLNVHKEMQDMPFLSCHECNRKVFVPQTNTSRTWKGKSLCNTCFSTKMEEREHIWKLIHDYKSNQCAICLKTKQNKDDRFHFDHINMFNKEANIYTMVSEGVDIIDLYKELDKCQLLCIECHHIVTYMERKTGFMSIKMSYTTNGLNLPENEHMQQLLKQQYEEKILPIYAELREIMRS